MLVFHDKDTFRCTGKVFAILFVPGRARLVNLEVRAKIVDLDYTKIILFNHATVRQRVLLREHNAKAKKQATTSDTVHNHNPILAVNTVASKE